MSLENFFADLIKKVEDSEEISNAGKDKDGFYKPTRTIILRHLQLIKDLHGKPLAKSMVQSSWQEVVQLLPAEWLVIPPEHREEFKRILS